MLDISKLWLDWKRLVSVEQKPLADEVFEVCIVISARSKRFGETCSVWKVAKTVAVVPS